jgi:hypothetical protein
MKRRKSMRDTRVKRAMRDTKIKRAVALVILIAVAGLVAFGRVNNDPPTDEEKDVAVKTANLLQAEVFATLLQEFGETTPENVEQGKQAISLVFHDSNRDMRLIGVFPPLLGGNNNIPSDPFERQSLALALQGQAEHNRRTPGQSLVLPPLNRAQQRHAHELRAMPHELHPAVLRADAQPRPVGRRAHAARAYQGGVKAAAVPRVPASGLTALSFGRRVEESSDGA